MRTGTNTTLPKKKPFIPNTPVVLIACCLACLSIQATVDAGVILDIEQVAGNVVATATGTANLSALSIIGSENAANGMNAFNAIVQAGSATDVNVYGNISGPTSFGPGTGKFEDSSSQSGDFFAVAGAAQAILVSTTYTSGDLISGTATWTGATFSSLGLNPGTYTYTWGSGPTADSLTVQVGASSVPEPATIWLLAMGAPASFAVHARFARSKHQRREGLQCPEAETE
jgi:hypothetical protein